MCFIVGIRKTTAANPTIRLWHNKNKTTEWKQTDFFGERVPFRAPGDQRNRIKLPGGSPALVGSVHSNGKTSFQKNLFALDPVRVG